MELFEKIKSKLRKNKSMVRVILPEGSNKTIQEVAARVTNDNILPILVFETIADANKVNISGIEKVIISDIDKNEMASYLVNLRGGKLSSQDALVWAKSRNYVAMTLLKQDKADALVGGIEYSSSDILRPALQIIKPKQGVSLISSVMYMIHKKEQILLSDCAINLYPNASELAQIAKNAIGAADIFDMKEKNVAMLSYSTKGSGKGASVDIVKEATELLSLSDIKANIDGEFQFDSAYVENVKSKKAPTSNLIGKKVNIMIFPNLDAGNIGYKIMQRVGGYEAIGPIIIGLDKAVNDLSRGATVEDVYKTVLLTSYSYLLSLDK